MSLRGSRSSSSSGTTPNQSSSSTPFPLSGLNSPSPRPLSRQGDVGSQQPGPVDFPSLAVFRLTYPRSPIPSVDASEREPMHEVKQVAGLFIGNVEAAKNQALLCKNKITDIVSLFDVPKGDRIPGFKYHDCAFTDSPDSDLTKVFDKALPIITERLIAGGRVLVHCEKGISRSAAVMMAFLIQEGHATSVDEALAKLRESRPCVEPNIGFVTQLEDWAKHLDERTRFRATSPRF